MNLPYLKNDHDLAVQDSETDRRFKGLSLWGDVEMEMWGRWCQFDDDSVNSLRAIGVHRMLTIITTMTYYHHDRIHDALEKDLPAGRTVQQRPAPSARVISSTRFGGLHHRYDWHLAA